MGASVNVVSVDPITYTPEPVVAVQEEKEREEKLRVEVERQLPALMQRAPPCVVAEQLVNVMEERESR